MERVNNNELFNDLFINMNSNIIVKGEDIKNIIPKENIKYLKTALKYISPAKLCKLYKSMNIVIEEREKDDTLLLAEYYMITYLVYILNSDIVKDTEKKELVDNFTKLYQRTLSNDEINTLSEKEILKVVDHTISQQKASFDPNFANLEHVDAERKENTVSNDKEEYDDPLYNDIVEFVIENQKASASLLQRRFKLGYNRAARIVDLLEERGIIGPQNGSKPREVLVKLEDSEDE